MEFHQASLPETAAALRSGELDLIDYISEIVRRVEATDAEVRALLPEPGRRERLLADARALLDRYPAPATRPPLFGIPVGVKDLLRADGFATRAGSFLPPEPLAGPEGTVVRTIKELGGIILGKTETDEFAHSEPPVTRNPRNLKHSPGGSSGGSAAAVAVGLCPLALGTQTMRSIIGPSSFCGVVGYKPSWQMTASDGLVYMAESIDTVGFLAQDLASIAMAARLLSLVGEIPEQAEKPVLGAPRDVNRSALHDYAAAAYEEQLQLLGKAGFTIRDVDTFDADYLAEVGRMGSRVLDYEMARIHNDWFARYSHLYRRRTHDGIVRGQQISEAEYRAGRAFQAAHRQKIEALMDAAGIDLWVLPGTNGAAPENYHVTGWGEQTMSWSFAGLGSVVFPAGLAPNGLPLGLQFIPRYGDDARLLGWARWVEPVFSRVRRSLMQAA